MKTVAQVLPGDTLDHVMEQVAPEDLHSEELSQFKAYLAKLDSKQLHSLQEELKAAARVRGRKIILRDQLMARLGTEFLRKQQELVEAQLASIEVARDTIDFNILELELSGHTWRLGKMTRVLRLDEQAECDPLVDMIKRQEADGEAEVMGIDGNLDDERLESIFGLR